MLASTLAWCVVLADRGLADTITLRGGGQVEGKVEPDPGNPKRVRIWMLHGRMPLVIDSDKITKVEPRPTPLDAYLAKVKAVGKNVQAEYDFGLWCEKVGLKDLAMVHYEAALRYDKSFEPAHKKLGHVFHDGYWLGKEELARAQGMVKYKGRWISAAERARRESEVEALEVQASWVRKLGLLRQAYLNGAVDRQREAEAQLMAIRDPKAVGALVRVFGDGERQERILLAHVLAKIPGREASRALVWRVVGEAAGDVRSTVFDLLKGRQDPEVVATLERALERADNAVVNRAAWALGGLNAVKAVPRLISKLITTESQIVLATPEQVQTPFNVTGTVGAPLVPIAANNGSVAFMSGPVVGPGAVAYGGYVVPYYAMAGAGFGVAAPPPQPDARVATIVYQNSEVLSTLEKLTGKNFGFDVELWREWLRMSFNPRPGGPARNVPQP